MEGDRGFFGHPRGLSTLFFTELWERFSYYGMRALLVLFMTDALSGGMGMTEERATAIYGLYTFGVYVLTLPGGWIADRLLGQRKAVLLGGILIALGHYALAVPALPTFYGGLVLIVMGTGFLKANVSVIVGDLYEPQSTRRDAGFSIFYMGINLGAFLGPIVCSYIGEPREGATWVSWHYGFGAAGVGMTLGLIQYVLGQKHLRGAGELKEDSALPEKLADARRKLAIGLVVALGVALSCWWLVASGAVSLVQFAGGLTVAVVIVAVLYFTWVVGYVCRDVIERRRVMLCALLFFCAAMFWSGFEQAGSSFNLFARDFTDRVIPGIAAPLRLIFGNEIGAAALQSVNAIFIILLAPVMGFVWLKLGARNPSIPVKFGLGMVFLGAGFFVLAWGSTGLPADGSAPLAAADRVGMRWLVATYFLHTVGELCLSPVGLSSFTKLSPGRISGQMMGTWFMALSLGNLIGGLIAGRLGDLSKVELFGAVGSIAAVVGLVFLVLARPMNRLAAGVR